MYASRKLLVVPKHVHTYVQTYNRHIRIEGRSYVYQYSTVQRSTRKRRKSARQAGPAVTWRPGRGSFLSLPLPLPAKGKYGRGWVRGLVRLRWGWMKGYTYKKYEILQLFTMDHETGAEQNGPVLEIKCCTAGHCLCGLVEPSLEEMGVDDRSSASRGRGNASKPRIGPFRQVRARAINASRSGDKTTGRYLTEARSSRNCALLLPRHPPPLPFFSRHPVTPHVAATKRKRRLGRGPHAELDDTAVQYEGKREGTRTCWG